MTRLEQKTFSSYVKELQSLLEENHVEHRFVGGASFGGLLNEKTSWQIDISKRSITLKNANLLPLYREDGTMKDIDLISLSPEKLPLSVVQYMSNPTHPPTVIEPAIFAPQKINAIAQLVTDIYVDKHHQPFLVFEPIRQLISWESLEPWTVHVNNIQYTVRNPIADYFAYQFRSPSGVKPKDEKKVILIKKLVTDIIKEGKKHHIDYLSDMYYGTWEKYVHDLHSSADSMVKGKQLFMSLYWATIGEYLAHGKGISRLFVSLHNKFTG